MLSLSRPSWYLLLHWNFSLRFDVNKIKKKKILLDGKVTATNINKSSKILKNKKQKIIRTVTQTCPINLHDGICSTSILGETWYLRLHPILGSTKKHIVISSLYWQPPNCKRTIILPFNLSNHRPVNFNNFSNKIGIVPAPNRLNA